MSSTSFLVSAGLLCGFCALLVFGLPILTEFLEQRRFRSELDAQDRDGSIAGPRAGKAGAAATGTKFPAGVRGGSAES
jgi:hypothetical protein